MTCKGKQTKGCMAVKRIAEWQYGNATIRIKHAANLYVVEVEKHDEFNWNWFDTMKEAREWGEREAEKMAAR
jgi:hypothetical protein